MEPCKLKLISLEPLKCSHAVSCKRSYLSPAIRKGNKAIIFKDCEPSFTTYLSISQILQKTESFKISHFNICVTPLKDSPKNDNFKLSYSQPATATESPGKTLTGSARVVRALRPKIQISKTKPFEKRQKREEKTQDRSLSLKIKLFKGPFEDQLGKPKF